MFKIYVYMTISMLTIFSKKIGDFLFGPVFRHIYFETYYQFKRTNIHIRRRRTFRFNIYNQTLMTPKIDRAS